jgi:hypothetical protein
MIPMLETDETLSVVAETKGMVKVSKLNVVLVEFDVNPVAYTSVKLETPATFRAVSVPVRVMLGCKAWETTRATLALATLPTKFEEFKLERPDAFPVKRFEFRIPDTLNDVNCPTDVMLVWAGFVTTPDVGTVETFAPFTFDRPDAFPTSRPACKTPETVRELKVPTEVMLG